jgi:hypothetical protein
MDILAPIIRGARMDPLQRSRVLQRAQRIPELCGSSPPDLAMIQDHGQIWTAEPDRR